MGELSETKKAILAIAPKITSILSMTGSAAILVECFHFDRSRLQLIHHRIICLMAIFDLVESPWNFVSTWAIPAESKEKFSAGNKSSCTAQGFFLQTSIAVVILNAFLSWYYLLVVRYSWTEEKIKAKAQPIIYGLSILFSLGTAIAGIPLNLYHPANLWCWIGSDKDPEKDSTNYFFTYRTAFYYGPLSFCTFVIIFNTAILVWTVRHIEGRSKKYTKQAYVERAAGVGDCGKWHLRKTSNRKKAKDAAEDGREKRMAELKRKLAEVQKTRSNPNPSCVNVGSSKVSGNTHSVMKLRAKKKQQGVMKDAEDRAQAESTSDDLRHVKSSSSAYADAFEGISSNAATHKHSKQKKRGKVTRSKTSIVARQSLYYVLAFFLTYIWSMINRSVMLAGRGSPFFFLFCHAFFDPIQGFLNYIVYIRPQFLAHRKKFPSLTIRQCLVSLITHKDFEVADSIAMLEDGAKEESRRWKLTSSGRVSVRNEHKSETNEDDPIGPRIPTSLRQISIIEEENILEENSEEDEDNNENNESSPLGRLSLDFLFAQDSGLDTVTNEADPTDPRILTSLPQMSTIEDGHYTEENIEEVYNIESSPLEPTSHEFTIAQDAGLDTV